jgi:Xaa-Pro aminopeptidase
VFEEAHKFDPKVLINKGEINTRLHSLLKGKTTVDCHPVESLKAVKDEREIRGFRECHVRDGAALCRFLAWLEHSLVVEGRTDLDEYGVTLKLENFRA